MRYIQGWELKWLFYIVLERSKPPYPQILCLCAEGRLISGMKQPSLADKGTK
jgi:hypothetical protein